jgi:hypothetical protein
MNYGELKTAVQNYCANSEASFVTNLPNFFIAAEDIILSIVDMSSRWKSDATATLVADQAEYDLRTFSGAGSLDVLSVRIAKSTAVTTGPIEEGPVIYLLQKDYDFLLEAYPASRSNVLHAYTGVPKYYAISSSKLSSSEPDITIRLGPIPDAAYTMTFNYYAKSPSTSITGGTDSTETWLSVTYPSVLLDGALAQAYGYMKGEPDMIQLYEKRFIDGISMIKNTDDTRLNSDDFRPITSPTMAPPRG